MQKQRDFLVFLVETNRDERKQRDVSGVRPF